MPAQKPSEPQSQNAQVSMDFFIPDLCAPRPALLSILLTELVVLVYVLVSTGLPGFDWDIFASCSLFVLWIVLFSSFLLCQCRGFFAHLSLPLAASSSLALVTFVTLITSVLTQVLFAQIATIPDGHWWVLRNLLVANVLAGIVLRYFYLQQQLRLQEKLELQARLDSLRTRIRPHFLFNTLNSIASLIMTSPSTAERAVEDLAELFRASLKESREATTVRDEVRLTRHYISVEELRLGSRLQVKWELDDRALEASMPTLVLQPLVENAVYHGISRLPEGGRIDILIACDGEEIIVSVNNPLPLDSLASQGNRMALDNVEQRLKAMYGQGATLVMFPGEEDFRIELKYTPKNLVT